MLLALLALTAAPARAADVLVPEATPRDLADFAVAYMFYEMVVGAGRDAGLDLDDADAIRRWAGTDADGCYDLEDCPGDLWSRTDARLAVVMSVGQAPGGLDVDVRLHGADEAAPFKVLRQVVPPGGEADFARTVARAARDALPLLPERAPPPAAIVLEDDVVRREPTEKASPELPQEEATVSGQGGGRVPGPTEGTTGRREDTDRPGAGRRPSADEERRDMRIPAGAYADYQESGMDRASWMAKRRVRSGRAHLELAGGWALGDVDRGYGVRVRLDESGGAFETAASSTWEGSGNGGGAGGWFAVGYAPTWFLETSIAGGAQWGEKHLNTGWECPPGSCQETASVVEHEPVVAVQAIIEPRARFFLVPTGIVKPYALVAFTLRLHDGVAVTDLADVDYPDAPGGATYGPTAGVGVSIDAAPHLSLFLEAPATLLVSPAEKAVQGSGVTQTPGTLDGAGFYARMVAGIGVRL